MLPSTARLPRPQSLCRQLQPQKALVWNPEMKRNWLHDLHFGLLRHGVFTSSRKRCRLFLVACNDKGMRNTPAQRQGDLLACVMAEQPMQQHREKQEQPFCNVCVCNQNYISCFKRLPVGKWHLKPGGCESENLLIFGPIDIFIDRKHSIS